MKWIYFFLLLPAAAAAKSLQSCPTLCDPIDSSPLGSSVAGVSPGKNTEVIIMRFFGFEYKSIGSIILFFLLATIISYPIGSVAEALPKVLLNEFHKGTVGQARFLYLFIDTIGTAFGLTVVDMFMDSVSATELAIFVVSFLLALPSVNTSSFVSFSFQLLRIAF